MVPIHKRELSDTTDYHVVKQKRKKTQHVLDIVRHRIWLLSRELLDRHTISGQTI